jgi:tripartite ATP-independent transporter DctP family solute receptor
MRINLQKILFAAAVCALVFAVMGCSKPQQGGGEAAQKKVALKVGAVWSQTHPIMRGIDNVFKPQVESKSNGAISVDVYYSNSLGNEQVLWDSVRNGAVEVVVIGSVMNSEYRPAMISDWPFLYRDIEHAKKVWTGSFVDDFIKDFQAKFPETQLLSVGPNSARTFTSNKPLTSVADFKGQKFRMPANPIHTGIVTDLGASAQVIPLNELFNSLQTGVVDGQDNGMVTVLSEKLNEVQKYLYETNHMVAVMNIVINTQVLNGLTADQQKIVRDAAKESAVWSWDDYIKSLDADRKTLTDSGVTVTACSENDRNLIIQAIQPTLNKLYTENDWAKALTDKARNVQ